MLTGNIADIAALRAGDARRNMPRFQGDNLRRNLLLVEELKKHAATERCSPSQLALAWVLSRAESRDDRCGFAHQTSTNQQLHKSSAGAERCGSGDHRDDDH